MRFEVSNGLTALHDVHVLFFRLGQIVLSLFCPFWVPYLVKLMRPPLFRAIGHQAPAAGEWATASGDLDLAGRVR